MAEQLLFEMTQPDLLRCSCCRCYMCLLLAMGSQGRADLESIFGVVKDTYTGQHVHPLLRLGWAKPDVVVVLLVRWWWWW